MKRLCFLAVLMVLSSSAYAGRSISFSVGSHRVHIESSRHCRSVSCASMSISRRLNWRHRRDRYDDDRDMAVPAKPAPSAPQTISPPAPPATTAPAKTIVAAPPPATYTTAASRSQIVAAPPPPARRTAAGSRDFDSSAAVSAGRKTGRDRAACAAGRARLASGRGRAVGFADRRLADRRQGNGADRKMRQCAVRLRARFVEREGRSNPDQHEAEDGKAMDRRRLQPGKR